MSADDALRDQLADVLSHRWRWLTGDARADLLADADALLPVVRAYAAQHLRNAALDWRRLTEGSSPAVRFLRARADALDPRKDNT